MPCWLLLWRLVRVVLLDRPLDRPADLTLVLLRGVEAIDLTPTAVTLAAAARLPAAMLPFLP